MLTDRMAARLSEQVAVFARQARYEIVALRPAETIAGPVLDAAGRGVRVRCVVPAGTLGQWLGVPVRYAAGLPGVLYVFDRRTALVAAADEGSVLLRDRGSVALLCELFERMWCGAAPPGLDGLTEQEAAAVRLLADGHTDDGIAKRLGVSSRTARRIVTGLIGRLEARGRFQAGVYAVWAGWLADRPG